MYTCSCNVHSSFKRRDLQENIPKNGNLYIARFKDSKNGKF